MNYTTLPYKYECRKVERVCNNNTEGIMKRQLDLLTNKNILTFASHYSHDINVYFHTISIFHFLILQLSSIPAYRNTSRVHLRLRATRLPQTSLNWMHNSNSAGTSLVNRCTSRTCVILSVEWSRRWQDNIKFSQLIRGCSDLLVPPPSSHQALLFRTHLNFLAFDSWQHGGKK